MEDVPNIENQNLRPNLHIVSRDKVPPFKGGIICDGNFGYDASGNPVDPEDKLIIDHHDKFDTRTYDTATSLVYRIINDKEERAEIDGDKYRNEEGELPIITNHIDSDSCLSTWVLYNREDPFVNDVDTRRIANSISWCGDFLLGTNVLKYGATARDYEYIIQNYSARVKEKVKDLRTRDLKSELEEKEKIVETIEKRLKSLEAKIDEAKKADEDLMTIQQQLGLLKKEGRIVPNGEVLKGKDKGLAIKDLNKKFFDLIKQKMSEEMEEYESYKKTLASTRTEIAKKQKSLKSVSKAPLSNEENLIVLNHMYDVLKDIIVNPFKYKKFLIQGREKEQSSITTADERYRKGEIEITADPHCEDLLLIRPIRSKNMPRPEQLDGQYFYFRRREDFNRELILTVSENKYILAINTQNIKGLKKHDFNLLIDMFRKREAELIDDAISRKKTKITSGEGDISKLKQEMNILLEDKDKNNRGQLWRNRTQMIFCFKSYIPEYELKNMVYEWRNNNVNIVERKK